MRLSLTVCAVILAASNAFASFYDGHRLREMADARSRVLANRGQGDDLQDTVTFNGYVLGVFDALEGLHQICPKRVSVDQVMQTVSTHVRRLPASKLSQPADTVVADALRGSFACAQNLFPPLQ